MFFFLCVGLCAPFLCDLDVSVYSICFYAYNNKFVIFRNSPVKHIKGQSVDTKFKKGLSKYRMYRVHPKI